MYKSNATKLSVSQNKHRGEIIRDRTHDKSNINQVLSVWFFVILQRYFATARFLTLENSALQAAVSQLITWTTQAAAPPFYTLLLRAEYPITHSAQSWHAENPSAQNRDVAGEMFGLIKGIFPDAVTWEKIG